MKRKSVVRSRPVWSRWVVALPVSLVLGAGTFWAVGAADTPETSNTDPIPEAVPDLVADAVTAFEAGDRVVVSPGSSQILSPESEAAVEEAIAAADAPMYVLVLRPSANAGWYLDSEVMDLLVREGPDGLYVLWMGSTTGQVGLSTTARLPSGYELEEAGVPREQAREFGDIRSYNMQGDAEARLSEWASYVPANLTDLDLPDSSAEFDRGERSAGRWVGAFTGAIAGGLLGLILAALVQRWRRTR